MKKAKILCAALMVLALYHFGAAIHQTGVRDGVGTDVYIAGYFANPWQAVIDFDLIAGLALAASWVLWRERGRAAGWVWVGILLYWGNLVVAIYVYRQLEISKGDWAYFFMGKRSRTRPPPVDSPKPRRQIVRVGLWATALALAAFIIVGCRSAGFAPAPVMGYVWGFGSLIPALLLLARTRNVGSGVEPSNHGKI